MSGSRLTQLLAPVARVTSPQSSITNNSAITGLSVVVQAGAARLILCMVKTRVYSSVSGDMLTVYVLRDSIIIDAQDYSMLPTIPAPQNFTTMDDSPAPGAHTYSVRVSHSSGTGSLTNAASATKPSLLAVFETGAY